MSTPLGRTRLAALTLAAVGVVYGDIGTSPLYAMRECFFGSHAVPPTPENVLGVLSLIVYSLVLVVSVKYVVVVMRADNQGEGGILALTSLLSPRAAPGRAEPALVLLGLFGAALLYGDGMITPAITVLSAVEGVRIATPLLEPYIVPTAVAILVVVFGLQRHGTHRIGRLFGPVMVVWFVVLAGIGLRSIADMPAVLAALAPTYAVAFFTHHGAHGLVVLGSVFLVVTGAEALYADMGHFGRRPIRLAWFGLVLPSLLLNYFGQGALLLRNPAADAPLFMMAPDWARPPLVVLATAAAVIASQALISGAFSLTRTAIQLGYAPRLDVAHTSAQEIGQVYAPQVNWLLAISTIAIVVGFQSSSALAAAYGIAVALTMLITGLLLPVVALRRWRVPMLAVVGLSLLFGAIDLAFVGANLFKILEGGWLPLVIAALLFTLMTTWKTGRRLVAERLTARVVPLEDFRATVEASRPARVAGAAVFMTAQPGGTPPALAYNLSYNKVLHESVFVLTVTTAPRPYVADETRVAVEPLGEGIASVRIEYGFMEAPAVPAALAQARRQGLVAYDEQDVTYFLGRETIVATGGGAWRGGASGCSG